MAAAAASDCSLVDSGSGVLQTSRSQHQSAGAQLALDLAKLAANLSVAAAAAADAAGPNLSPTGNGMGAGSPGVGAASSPVLGRSLATPSTAGSVVGGALMVDVQAPGFGGGAGNRKSANMTECVPVPSSEHVAEIVGRQGSKIKALRAKTNTYIKTPVRGEEPVFVVTGRREDVAAAKREILSASEHFSQIRASRLNAGNGTGTIPGSGGRPCPPTGPDASEQVTIHVRVPYRVVGLVVGPKGATIKRIQQDSATYIVTPSRDREPVFEVTGTCDGVEKARRDIESYIALRTGTMPEPGTGSSSSSSAAAASTTMQSMCSNSDLDARVLLGSFLKSASPSAASNSSSAAAAAAAAALMSYNNAINLGSGRFLSNEMSGKSSAAGCRYPCENGNTVTSMYDYNNGGSMRSYGKSIMSSNNNNNNSLIGDSWSMDVVGTNIRSLASLFPLADEFPVFGNGSGLKCPSGAVDEGIGLSPLDALVANYSNMASTSGLDCCVGRTPYGMVIADGDGVPTLFHHNGAGSGRSLSESSASASPTDSSASPRRLGGGCCLCNDGVIAAALVPCGHNLFCKSCADMIVSRPDPDERRCPACGDQASLAIRILS